MDGRRPTYRFHPGRWRTAALSVSLLLLILATTATASSGDRDSIYTNCVQKCRFTSCRNQPAADESLPLSLRLLQWTCPQNCQYECMHDLTSLNVQTGERVQQFHGKWPFIRLWGVQEPASVLFSVLNGWMHFRGYRKLRTLSPRWYPMRRVLLLNALLGVNAWIWSTVFHARDFPITEKLDYFSAIGSLLMGSYLALTRAFELYRDPATSTPTRRGLAYAMLAFYAAHVSYLTFWPFDYGYNMKAGIVVGAVANLAWVSWAVRNWRTRPYAWKIVVMVVAITAAMALEVLDFPPWMWVLDAHALWHAATIPLVRFYYEFLVDDVRWEVRIGKGKGKVAVQ
ncbi:Per1-like-domain-containing protein [Fimicolochytrium jonesii]|uniref:Per1-like-domain-containing protein n=1 Tax=Fimicolochytrium jonesii TaxID=1396493 RepID=UPI0022FDF9AC|nr:Per1-like-domain-containing protein [Fimicolochytrium jonesii]KAI8816444.1 Per1-like-domain-containing protein [Fimicolochytrium jonesii]